MRWSKAKVHTGKFIRAADGGTYPADSIIVARWVQPGERCEALVHGRGWHTFGPRASATIPSDRFRHCTAKFQQEQAGDPVGAQEPVARARKGRRATWVEEPSGSVAVEVAMAGAAGPPEVAPQGQEDQMGNEGNEGNAQRAAQAAKRFNVRKHSDLLLTAVGEFQRRHGYRSMFDRWEAFAEEANRSAHLAPWAANAICWRARYLAASAAGGTRGWQREVGDRVRCLVRDHGGTLSALAGALGWPPEAPSQIFTGRRALEEDDLVNMALALGGCTTAAEVCPDMAREMFPGEPMVGLQGETGGSGMYLLRGEGPGMRAYQCYGDGLAGWKIVPAGMVQIDPRPAEAADPEREGEP